ELRRTSTRYLQRTSHTLQTTPPTRTLLVVEVLQRILHQHLICTTTRQITRQQTPTRPEQERRQQRARPERDRSGHRLMHLSPPFSCRVRAAFQPALNNLVLP